MIVANRSRRCGVTDHALDCSPPSSSGAVAPGLIARRYDSVAGRLKQIGRSRGGGPEPDSEPCQEGRPQCR